MALEKDFAKMLDSAAWAYYISKLEEEINFLKNAVSHPPAGEFFDSALRTAILQGEISGLRKAGMPLAKSLLQKLNTRSQLKEIREPERA